MDILVDVIIPVYNKETTIAKCLESILVQTYEKINIIVIDDGSTDSSYEVCSSFQDDRIRIIRQKNAGVGEARNTGLRYLTGDKFVFVDADDYVSPTYIEDLLKYADENSELVVQGYYSCLEDGSRCEKRMPYERLIRKSEFEKYLFDINYFKFLTMPWNKLFDSNIVRKNNLLFRRIDLGEDVCFVFDYLQYVNNVNFVKDTNYYYIESVGSLTRVDIPNIWERQKDINNYCRKDYYQLYGRTWTNMYIRAVKRTLGESAGKNNKFDNQIKKIRSDRDFELIKTRNIKGNKNKVIYLLIRFKMVRLLRFLFVHL